MPTDLCDGLVGRTSGNPIGMKRGARSAQVEAPGVKIRIVGALRITTFLCQKSKRSKGTNVELGIESAPVLR
jgi:hypothetical protein